MKRRSRPVDPSGHAAMRSVMPLSERADTREAQRTAVVGSADRAFFLGQDTSPKRRGGMRTPGKDDVVAGCIALLRGGEGDAELIFALGGPPARWAVAGEEPRGQPTLEERLPSTVRGRRRWFRRDHLEQVAAARAAAASRQ
jgi:hypothetical protein